MTVFLLTFVSIYSLMHAFFYSRVRVLLPERWTFHFLLILFLALMTFAPIGTRLLERNDHYQLAKTFAFLGYSWMGFVFYAFWCFLLIGIIGIAFKVTNMAFGLSLPLFSGRKAALAVLAITLAISIYGVVEARWIRVERVVIRTAKLPAGVDRVRIAQISDVHLGLLLGNGRLEGILAKVEGERPDILVSTGDLVDGDMVKIGNLRPAFERIDARYGKFAVSGNHEVFAGLERSLRAEEDFGFKVLRGQVHNVLNVINLVGVDDPMTGEQVDERALLASTQNGLFTILLKHRPEAPPSSIGLFDLQLSGHTHSGQLFPFRLFSQRVYPMQNGLYHLEKGSMVYTSRGSGTWGPPLRVLAPPEITIFDIVRES